jgi:hypothetical protein
MRLKRPAQLDYGVQTTLYKKGLFESHCHGYEGHVDELFHHNPAFQEQSGKGLPAVANEHSKYCPLPRCETSPCGQVTLCHAGIRGIFKLSGERGSNLLSQISGQGPR